MFLASAVALVALLMPNAAYAAVTTTLPKSAVSPSPSKTESITDIMIKGYTALPTARVISGSFDGKMVKYDRKGSGGACAGQDEKGEDAAVFILQAGATLSNVIIGKDQAEGVHCRGACTLNNVWWEDFKQTGSGDVSTVNGGGAFSASDKICESLHSSQRSHGTTNIYQVQHNGAGTVKISNFFANSFGKLYRSCGNCDKSYKRTVVVDNEGVGINSNFGDTATLSNIKTNGKPSSSNVCCTYKGVSKGSEPSKIGWSVPLLSHGRFTERLLSVARAIARAKFPVLSEVAKLTSGYELAL
ncbi:10610_t:CDS:2, partial [Acaulospora colombiana]